MTEAELLEIDAWLREVTPGPWDALHEVDHPERGAVLASRDPERVGWGSLLMLSAMLPPLKSGLEARFRSIADAEFAARARTALPLLVDEVRRLRVALGQTEDK